MSFGDARGRSFHDGKLDPTPGGRGPRATISRNNGNGPSSSESADGHGHRLERMDAGRLASRDGTVDLRRPVRRGIQPRHRADAGRPRRQLLLAVRGRHPPLQGCAADTKGLGPRTIRIDGGFDSGGTWAPSSRSRRRLRPSRLRWQRPACIMPTALAATNYWPRRSRATTEACISTCEPVIRSVPTNRMDGLWLFLKTDRNAAVSWEGCNFLVGRLSEPDGVWLEENTGGWNWKKVAKAPYRVAGRELQMAIPRRCVAPCETRCGHVVRLQVGRQSPAAGRRDGLLPERRRRARRPVLLPLRSRMSVQLRGRTAVVQQGPTALGHVDFTRNSRVNRPAPPRFRHPAAGDLRGDLVSKDLAPQTRNQWKGKLC